jgi:hypothetical protein
MSEATSGVDMQRARSIPHIASLMRTTCFAAHVAFCPDCTTTRDDSDVSDKPIRILHGSLDAGPEDMEIIDDLEPGPVLINRGGWDHARWMSAMAPTGARRLTLPYAREAGPIGDIRDGRGRQRQQANGLHLSAPGRPPSSARRQYHRTPDETADCLRLSNQDRGTTGP